MPNCGYFVSVGLQWTNRKIGKVVTLYQREFFKKIPRLGTFCTQSVNEGLIVICKPTAVRNQDYRTTEFFDDSDRRRITNIPISQLTAADDKLQVAVHCPYE